METTIKKLHALHISNPQNMQEVKILFDPQGLNERTQYAEVNQRYFEDVMDALLPNGVDFPRGVDDQGFKDWVLDRMVQSEPGVFLGRRDEDRLTVAQGVTAEGIRFAMFRVIIKNFLYKVELSGAVNGRRRSVVFNHPVISGFELYHMTADGGNPYTFW